MNLTDAKVYFTKDFRNKTEEKLTTHQKGGLIRERLAAAQENGQLGEARDRYAVATLLGYGEKSRTGHALVTNKVQSGALEERVSVDEEGNYRYYFTYHPEKEAIFNKKKSRRRRAGQKAVKRYPDFSEVNAEIAAAKAKVMKEMKQTADKNAQKEPTTAEKQNDMVKVTYRGVTVEVYVTQVEFIAQLIKKLGEDYGQHD